MTVTPPEYVPDSILQSTKKALGLTLDYTPFDAELVIHINSVLANLNQLGIGPDGGMLIEDETPTWSDFLRRVDEVVPDPRLNHVKSYVYMRVRMLFDPPSVGYLVTSYEKMILEAEWRIMVAQDDVIHPRAPAPPPIIPWYVEQEVVLDGGDP